LEFGKAIRLERHVSALQHARFLIGEAMARGFLVVVLLSMAAGCSSASTPQIPADAGSAPRAPEAGSGDAGRSQPSVDKSKLAPDECSAAIDCKTPGTGCFDFSELANGDPELERPRCAPSSACDVVTCPPRETCLIKETTPGIVSCAK
jgi:hypothetical protein